MLNLSWKKNWSMQDYKFQKTLIITVGASFIVVHIGRKQANNYPNYFIANLDNFYYTKILGYLYCVNL